MKLKKLVLMSSSIIGVGLIAPVAMQINQNKIKKVSSNVNLSDNQYGYSKSSEPHDNWTYDLGIGTNDLKTLIGTTYSYEAQAGYVYQHKAGDAFGIADAWHHGGGGPLPWHYGTYYNQIPIWYFDTPGAWHWTVYRLPRFSHQFDSDMSAVESNMFSKDYVQNQISYGNEWTNAYKNNEGVIIHFHTWYSNAFHTILYDTVSIKTASQSVWNETFG